MGAFGTGTFGLGTFGVGGDSGDPVDPVDPVDATVTASRAEASASGRTPIVSTSADDVPTDASVTVERAEAHATYGIPAVAIVSAGDTVIEVVRANALAYGSEADLEVSDETGLVIQVRRALASAIAPDSTVTATQAASTNTRHRWSLYDPATGERWEFPHNPNKMASPHRPRSISIFVTPPLYNPAVEARGGMARIYETNVAPYEWTFSGWIRDEEQYEQLVYWTRKVTRVQLTDHFGRRWLVRFKEFDPDEQRPSHRSDWRFDYEIKSTMYGAVA